MAFENSSIAIAVPTTPSSISITTTRTHIIMTSETTPLTSYGSVPTTIETVEQGGAAFQEGNVYYLKERPLSSKERFQKLILVAVPLFVSLLIVGGAAFFLFRGFDHLYPGPGEEGHVDIPHFTPSAHNFDEATPPEAAPVHEPFGPPIASPVSVPAPTSSSSTTTTTASSGGGKSGDGKSEGGDSDCSAHANCVALGLTGSCCPSTGGIFLNCCH